MAHEPESLYAHVEEEGRRRLARPRLELATTALVAGFDIVFGITAYGIAAHLTQERFGTAFGELVGALAFGIAFVFVVAGRSELFTENFMVPIAGLDRRDRRSWLGLAELWAVSPVMNVAGGVLLLLVLSAEDVLPAGAGPVLVDLAERIEARDTVTIFLSAVAAGALITLMTWIVEGLAEMVGVKLAVAWVFGSFLALGHFDHVIVATLELVYGLRFGAEVGASDIAANFGLAAVGNLVGGILFVTLTRMGQARSRRTEDGR